MIPKDPVILLSIIYTMLRDAYASLADLCASLDADESAIRDTLAGLDYRYDSVHNRFI